METCFILRQGLLGTLNQNVYVRTYFCPSWLDLILNLF